MMKSRYGTLLMFALLGCASGWSDEIRFGFKSVPPYVMLDANRRISGLEFEIIVAALAASGHTVKAEIMPLERLVRTFKSGSLQAAAPMLPSTNSGGLLSDEYITYTNVVMGLESDSLKIRSTADLKGLRIAAFQTATKVLGADFAAAVRGNRQYKEDAQQIIHIRLLFRKRVDVVVGDTRILHHFIDAPETMVDKRIAVEEFPIFPPTRYRVAFRDAGLVRDFNAGLAKIRKNGTYDALMRKYR